MADRNGYIGRAPGDSSVIVARKVYEPTGVQTDFTFNSGYTPGYCDVYLNGVRLIDEKDFTASNGSTVGLTSAAQSGDVVELVVYKAYNLGVPLADVTGNLDVTGNISASSSITADGAFYGDGSNLSNIAGVAITQYIAANSLTVLGSPGVSTITRLGATDLNVTGIITANGLSGNVTGAALTITGNATFNSNVTIGGTLTYEDVTNVDALGIVTARAGVNVSGGQLLVGSGVTIGNAGVATFSGTGDVHLLDNVKLNIGDGPDLQLSHSGTNSVIDNNTGGLYIRNNVGGDVGGNIFIQAKSGENSAIFTHDGSAALHHDNVKKFETSTTGATITGEATATAGLIVGSGLTIGSAGVATFSGTADVHLHDNVRLNVGDASDVAIYHNGTHSYIDNSTGDLYIRGNGDDLILEAADDIYITPQDGENGIKVLGDSAVELYFDNDRKLKTISTGVQVENATGDTNFIVLAEEDDSSTDAILQIRTTNTSASSYLMFGDGDDSNIGKIRYLHSNDDMLFYTNDTEKWRITSAGNLQNNSDSGKLQLGTSEDLEIYHNGSHSFIDDSGTGNLYIRAGTDNGITLNTDADVILYYDNSLKFQTTTDGTKTTGIATATGGHITGGGEFKVGTGVTIASTSGVATFSENVDFNKQLSFKDGSGSGGTSKLTFGNSDDLNIFHNGSYSYIKDSGTGGIVINTDALYVKNAADNEALAYFTQDGAVDLYYNNSKKFETTNDGVKITGIGTFTNGLDTVGMLRESFNTVAGKLSDNTNIDLNQGMIHYFTTQETTTSTPNIRFSSSKSLNNMMSSGDVVSLTVITTAAAGGYSANWTIDGSAVTEEWVGGSAPSAGGSDGLDIYGITILKTGDGAYKFIGNLTNAT